PPRRLHRFLAHRTPHARAYPPRRPAEATRPAAARRAPAARARGRKRSAGAPRVAVPAALSRRWPHVAFILLTVPDERRSNRSAENSSAYRPILAEMSSISRKFCPTDW